MERQRSGCVRTVCARSWHLVWYWIGIVIRHNRIISGLSCPLKDEKLFLPRWFHRLKPNRCQEKATNSISYEDLPLSCCCFFFHVSVPALREGSKKKYRVNWSGCCYAEINVGDETAAFWWRLLNSVVSESFETMGNKTRSGINYGFLTLIVRKRDMTVTLGYFNSVVKMWAAAAVKAAKRLFPPNWRLVLLLGQNPG